MDYKLLIIPVVIVVLGIIFMIHDFTTFINASIVAELTVLKLS